MKSIVIPITLLVLVFFVGCGGGSDTTVTEPEVANTATILTRDDAAKAIGAVQSMRLDMLASALSQSLQTQLGAQAAPNRVTYPIPYAKERECSVSGTVNTTGEKSDLFTYHATNVFDNCTHLDNIVVNGTQTVDATLKNNKLVASLSDNNIEVSMGAKSMHLSDPIQLYSNLDFSRVEVILLEDGQILKDETPSQEVFMDINVTLDTKQATMYLNGFTQIYGCGDEGYDIQTIEPVIANIEGTFTSGTLKINGALFKFNSDNTVTVTLTNGHVYTEIQSKDVICELNPNELRYIRVRAKEVVFDTTTELMWQDNEVVSRPWLTKKNFDAQNWFDTSGDILEDTAASYCSTSIFERYYGWRLPTQMELASLLDTNGIMVPTISPVFKHTASSEYWSIETIHERNALTVDFEHASLDDDSKDATHAVRCVRDMSEKQRYIRDSAKEVVIDTKTQKMWQDNREAQTVRKPIVTKENYDAINWFDFSGDTAATYCSELTLGGYNDWRLPSWGDLYDITYEIEGEATPYIHPLFQNVSSELYWSSDIGGASGQGAAVDFWTAFIDDEDIKYNNHAVRCVRDN